MNSVLVSFTNFDLKNLISRSPGMIGHYFQKTLRRNWPERKVTDNGNYAIVIVSSNTKQLLTYLLFSIFNNLGTERISAIVVVDNASTDGSLQLLQRFEEQKLVTLIRNRKQRYHGPSLNQGINCLSRLVRKNKIDKPFKYIWILDSDVIILKANVLNDVTQFMRDSDASVIGQFQFDHSKLGDPHISSLIINPAYTWKRRISPFINHGMPSVLFYSSVRKNGLYICDFPFRSMNYILHLGRGTLKQINISNDVKNQYYEWALTHYEYHFHGNPKGALLLEKTAQLFHSKVGEINDTNICNLFMSGKVFVEDFDHILRTLITA